MKTLKHPARKPSVVNTPESWEQMICSIANASGPVAIDVERAQSFRYSDKAYLVQIRRAGAGTFLIDPIAFEDGQIADFSELSQAIGDGEWILHAATQDLPNLWELNMRPASLFDTELAGRLLGFERVNLAAMIERYFDLHLEKQHSADDWSTRPIPDDWIDYAALDVELLIEMREKIINELEEAGKDEIARQEFAYLIEWAERHEPSDTHTNWRRTSGIQDVHSRRGMALVRELYLRRDEIAKRLDKAPHKILIDKAISELASKTSEDKVPTASAMRSVLGFKRREARKHQSTWQEALETVARLPKNELPEIRVKSSGVPKPRAWQRINPDAAKRWEAVRPKIVERAEEMKLPVENLVSPRALRELLWEPELDLDAQLRELGVREWQREEILPIIEAQLAG